MRNSNLNVILALGLFATTACEEGEGIEPDTVDRTETQELEGQTGEEKPAGEQEREAMQPAPQQPTQQGEPFARMQEWDQDQNQQLSQQELEQGLQEKIGEWDQNDDDALDQQEFGSGLFQAWNQNGDQQIDQNEFRSGTQSWFGQDFQGQLSQWDQDNDQQLSQQELQRGMGQGQVFSQWDQNSDQKLQQDEVSQQLFQQMDQNSDDSIDQNEWPWG